MAVGKLDEALQGGGLASWMKIKHWPFNLTTIWESLVTLTSRLVAKPDWRIVFKIRRGRRDWRQAGIDNFQRGAKPWGSSWWGVRLKSDSPLIGRNYSKFVQFRVRSAKKGKM